MERAWREDAGDDPDAEPVWYEQLEKLANKFASHLLLPADSVHAALRAKAAGRPDPVGPPNVEDLILIAHATFHVSTQALVWRLQDLNVISRDLALELTQDRDLAARDRRLRPRRWRTPAGPFTDRYWQLARSAYDRGRAGLARLAEYTETDVGELDAILNPSDDGLHDAAAAATSPA